MPQFHEVIPETTTAFGTNFMTGMLLLGAFVGCIFMPTLADKMSRKWALTAVVVVFNIGAILQTAAFSYGMLVTGRAIGGIGVGTLAMGAPLYISEIAPRTSVDSLISLSKLRRLPETDERVQAEYKSIVAEVEFQRLMQEAKHPGVSGLKFEVLLWLDLFDGKNWRRVVVGCGVCFFQQFSGINAFIYYAPTLFQSIGQDYEMSLILSGIFNILQLVAVAICFVIIDKVGRKPLAIVGGFGSALCYIVIAALAGVYSKSWSSNPAAGWACVAMAFLFIIVYGVSYSPLGWALPPEVFSTSTRAKGVALSVCVNWLANFVIGIATPPMVESIGFGAYVFFAVFCALSGFWAWFLVPETMGKTLEQMDEVFGDTSGQEEQDMMRRALQNAEHA
ncbi:hypothetical protein V2G26_007513 [Clonostachys chloroleuca]